MEDISGWVKDNFGFSGEVKVMPLRQYTNDVYQVENGGKHLLKVYGEGWKTESEIQWEIELLDYLKGHSVDVAGVISGKSGKKLFTLDLGGTKRLAVMFEWARGNKPEPPFSLDDYDRLGKAIAEIHRISDGFESNKDRPELDLDYLIDKPLRIILNSTSGDRAQHFQTYAGKLKDFIQKFESEGLDWGVVHSDVTFDNIHVTDEGEVVFYDFDSGGPGWRAIDLQGWAVFEPDTAPRQIAFIRGYRSVRVISDNDVAASPYLHAANEFWGVGLDLSKRVLKRGEQEIDKYLDEKIKAFESFISYFERFE